MRASEPPVRRPPPLPDRLRRIPHRIVELRKRLLRLPRLVLIPLVIAVVATLALAAGWGFGLFGNGSAHPDSAPVGPAAVYSSVGFGDSSNQSVNSGPFSSAPGSTILVWVSLYEYSTVSSISDSAGDVFHPLASSTMEFGTTDAYNGLAIWGSTDVAGGSAVHVTATLSTICLKCSIHSAIVVVDIDGVGSHPIHSVGPLVNSSKLPNQQSQGFFCEVNAPASAMVLAGVAARNMENFTATGGDSLVEQQGTVGTGYSDSMTTAVFVATQGAAPGSMWVNATSFATFAWVAGAVVL